MVDAWYFQSAWRRNLTAGSTQGFGAYVPIGADNLSEVGRDRRANQTSCRGDRLSKGFGSSYCADDPQRRCERHEKKIQELQEELLNIKENLDNRTDMANATKHMSTNDKLQEAKKAAINSILYPICKMIVMQMGAADFLSFVCSFWKDILQIT